MIADTEADYERTIASINRPLLPALGSIQYRELFNRCHAVSEQDAWGRLTLKEQHIVSVKLPGAEDRSAQHEFNIRFTGRTDIETEAMVTTVRNLIINAGGHSDSPVWRLIRSIDGGWVDWKNPSSAALALSVPDPCYFLSTLADEGYDVNRYYEMAGKHRHSARFVTETSRQPGMHFVQLGDYPETRFDVHWDRRSSAFRNVDWRCYVFGPFARIVERVVAGISHNRAVSAARVRRELKKMGLAPEGEI